MSLFRRLFKPKMTLVEKPSYEGLLETVGLLLLANRERRDDTLRRSERFGELLGLLWLDDKRAHRVVWEAFNSVEKIDREFVELLARRVYNLQHDLPTVPEGRYAIVVQALQEELTDIAELVAESVSTSTETKLFVNILTLARILLPAELHGPVCEFLVANNRGRKEDPRGGESLPYQELVRDNIYRFLGALTPDTIPVFWEMLRDETVTMELWPALRRIRGRGAVPYLLDLLPAAEDVQGTSVMNLDGQKEVIQVLREIGDLRAVPALQAMEKRLLPPPEEKAGVQTTWDRALSKTWRERNDLARAAGQAARHILRFSGEAAAQLLRPAEPAAKSGETLLRPFHSDPGATPAEELMRAAEKPGGTDPIL